MMIDVFSQINLISSLIASKLVRYSYFLLDGQEKWDIFLKNNLVMLTGKFLTIFPCATGQKMCVLSRVLLVS